MMNEIHYTNVSPAWVAATPIIFNAFILVPLHLPHRYVPHLILTCLE